MGKSAETKQSFTASIKNKLKSRLFILQWMPKYTKNDILADLIAGLTVGLTMMPQSIAYAGLAGLSAQYGLYTAFIGSFTYIFVGTIKEVSIGPTSLMSLLTYGYTAGKPIECVILLTFIAGCEELLMGIFNLGFLVDFISPCLTSGFTSATSIIIASAQLKNILGVNIKSHQAPGILKELFEKFDTIKLHDTAMGFLCIAVLLFFKNINKLIKTSNTTVKKILWLLGISKNAIVVLISTIIAGIYTVDGKCPFGITGNVAKGIPVLRFPSLSAKFNNETMGFGEMVTSLGSGIFVVPFVGVLSNVAIAKSYSKNSILDASQEMISLGLANILGSFVQAMPSSGAFTRSAVASSSDVRTPLQGLYSGKMIPAFYNEFYDAEQEEQRQELARERRNLRNESNPFELPDEEFRKLYRLTKELVQDLITELEPHMDHGQRNTRLPINLRVLAALRFFTHGSYQRCIGANENIYVAQQTMSDIIQEVCNAIENIAPRYIKFPTTIDDMNLNKERFWNTYNFPGTVGCVDGTHVAIIKPNEDEHLYLNRKGYHSKNVQIICDADLKILSVNANFGGATHDAFIWRNSGAATFLEQNYGNGDHNTWLLGDSGYPQQPWLMTPIRNAPRDSPEGRYNAALVSARCTVERCIGVLKMRFRCINKERVLRYSPFKAGQIINVCAVLHNICIMGNVPIEGEENYENDDVELNDNADNAVQNVVIEGQERRQQLIDAYFQ